MPSFTDVGPKSGPYLHRDDLEAAFGVLQARHVHTYIGIALPVGWDEADRSLWRLTVHGAEVPGRRIVVHREFRPT
jgi:hypothetical protein